MAIGLFFIACLIGLTFMGGPNNTQQSSEEKVGSALLRLLKEIDKSNDK